MAIYSDLVKVGVVTVTYNSGKVIDEFMKSILQQSHRNYVLYVVDNISTDDTLEKLSNYHDTRLNLTINQQNNGFTGGNNQGIKNAIIDGCDQILLLNNDTVFESKLIEKLIIALEEYQCDVVTPKIMYHHDPRKIWTAGGFFDRRRAWAGTHYGLNEMDVGQYEIPKQVYFSPACCMLIKKEVFNIIGYFDENYFCYFEDTDFCYRAMGKSLVMYYYPSVHFLHKVSSLTGGSNSVFSIRYLTRNKVYFMRKHIEFPVQIFWIVLYELELIRWFLSKQNTFKEFVVRQRSFVEGLTISQH